MRRLWSLIDKSCLWWQTPRHTHNLKNQHQPSSVQPLWFHLLSDVLTPLLPARCTAQCSSRSQRRCDSCGQWKGSVTDVSAECVNPGAPSCRVWGWNLSCGYCQPSGGNDQKPYKPGLGSLILAGGSAGVSVDEPLALSRVLVALQRRLLVCMQVNKWQTKHSRIELRCNLPPTLHSLEKHRFPVYAVPRLCLITLKGALHAAFTQTFLQILQFCIGLFW